MLSAPAHPIDAERCDVVLRDARDARVVVKFAVGLIVLVAVAFMAGAISADLFPAAPASRCAPHLALWEPRP